MSVTINLYKYDASNSSHDPLDPTTFGYYEVIDSSTLPDGEHLWELVDDGSYGAGIYSVHIYDTLTSNGGFSPPFEILEDTDFTDVYDPSSKFPCRISNYGNKLRFALGTDDQPRVYQKIDRSFFWDPSNDAFAHTYDDYYLDIAHPRLPETFDISFSPGGIDDSGGSLPFSDSRRVCYYKVIPVFDGNQELNFDKNYAYFDIPSAPEGESNTNNVKLTLGMDTDNFNPRITAINLYRAITDGYIPDDGEFRLINTYSTILGDDVSWIDTTAGYGGSQIFSDGESDFSDVPINTDAWLHSVGVDSNGNDLGDDLYEDMYQVETEGKEVLYGASEFMFVDAEVASDLAEDDHKNYWGTNSQDGKRKWMIVGVQESPNTGFEVNIEGITSLYSYTQSNEACTLVQETSASHVGNNCLSLEGNNSSTIIRDDYVFETTDLVPALTGEKYYIELYYKGGAVLSGSPRIKCRLEISEGEDTEIFDYGPQLSASLPWGSTQAIYTATSDEGFNVKVYQDIYRPGNHLDDYEFNSVFFDSFSIRKIYHEASDTPSNIYTGNNVFAVDASGVAPTEAVNKIAQFSNNDYIVTANKTDVFQVVGNLASEDQTNNRVISGSDVKWGVDDTAVSLEMYDSGQIDGRYHPIAGTSSIEVNYKYSAFTDGRLFAGNVKIDPNGSNPEDHDNWIIFSELSQPDVLPISNFIQLEDLQGGSITGLASMLGDLVVFMERGIYRLSVPSTDPHGWSLMESEENIGCQAPDSIIKVEGGVYFASPDSIYYLDANFKANPISLAIQDEYQALTNSKTKLFYNVKKRNIMCKLGDEAQNIWVFDLMTQSWHKNDTASKNSELFTIDENLTPYSFSYVIQGNEYDTVMYDLVPALTGEFTSMQFRTGWIPITQTLDDNAIIRRVDARIESPDSITINIYADEDLTAPVWTSDFSGAKQFSKRVGRRAKNILVEIISPNSISPVEIKRLEVEID